MNMTPNLRSSFTFAAETTIRTMHTAVEVTVRCVGIGDTLMAALKESHSIVYVTGTPEGTEGTPLEVEEKWEFPITALGTAAFIRSLGELKARVAAQEPTPHSRLTETSIDVYDWLRIGVLESEGVSWGFLEFSQSGSRLRTDIEDIEAIENLLRAILGVTNGWLGDAG